MQIKPTYIKKGKYLVHKLGTNHCFGFVLAYAGWYFYYKQHDVSKQQDTYNKFCNCKIKKFSF